MVEGARRCGNACRSAASLRGAQAALMQQMAFLQNPQGSRTNTPHLKQYHQFAFARPKLRPSACALKGARAQSIHHGLLTSASNMFHETDGLHAVQELNTLPKSGEPVPATDMRSPLDVHNISTAPIGPGRPPATLQHQTLAHDRGTPPRRRRRGPATTRRVPTPGPGPGTTSRA